MGQSPQIQPRSRDNGPESPDTAQIPGQWASVPRYGPDPGTMGQSPQIQPRSRDNGPASADTAQIPGQRPLYRVEHRQRLGVDREPATGEEEVGLRRQGALAQLLDGHPATEADAHP